MINVIILSVLALILIVNIIYRSSERFREWGRRKLKDSEVTPSDVVKGIFGQVVFSGLSIATIKKAYQLWKTAPEGSPIRLLVSFIIGLAIGMLVWTFISIINGMINRSTVMRRSDMPEESYVPEESVDNAEVERELLEFLEQDGQPSLAEMLKSGIRTER